MLCFGCSNCQNENPPRFCSTCENPPWKRKKNVEILIRFRIVCQIWVESPRFHWEVLGLSLYVLCPWVGSCAYPEFEFLEWVYRTLSRIGSRFTYFFGVHPIIFMNKLIPFFIFSKLNNWSRHPKLNSWQIALKQGCQWTGLNPIPT